MKFEFCTLQFWKTVEGELDRTVVLNIGEGNRESMLVSRSQRGFPGGSERHVARAGEQRLDKKGEPVVDFVQL